MRLCVNGWFNASLESGSGQYLAALVQRLPALRPHHENVLVRSRARPGALRAPVPEGWEVEDVSTPFDRRNEDLAKLWFEQIAFPRTCGRLGANVAWVPYWGSPWWSPCPVAVTVHDLIPLLLPAYRGGLMQRAYTALVARTARRAAVLLTDSEVSKRDIVTRLRLPAARVHVVHLAASNVDAAIHTDVGDVRSRYGLPAGPFLLYLGGFDVRKNVVRTIEAFARLVRRREAAGERPPDLVIAGQLPAKDSPFMPDPRSTVTQLGIQDRVHFTGRIEEADKPALYREALATLFLSEYEGFGLPVLEAMASPTVGAPGRTTFIYPD